MSITGIILAAVIVGGTGLFIGIFLGFSGKKFAVNVDKEKRPSWKPSREITAAAAAMRDVPDWLRRS